MTTAAVLAVEPGQKKDQAGAPADTTVPAVSYVVASPRAFLMGVPVIDAKEWAVIGAVENFPRAHGTAEIPVGTRVIFSLGQRAEAAWQGDACGTIGMRWTVPWFPAQAELEDDAGAAQRSCEGPTLSRTIKTQTKAGESVPGPWITIAIVGAPDTRRGSNLGDRRIGVPAEFPQPGACCVRGIGSSSVHTLSPRSPELSTQEDAARDSSLGGRDVATDLADAPSALDTEVVLVKVQVVDRLIPGSAPQGPTAADPDVMSMVLMPDPADAKAVRTNEDDRRTPGRARACGLAPESFSARGMQVARAPSQGIWQLNTVAGCLAVGF